MRQHYCTIVQRIELHSNYRVSRLRQEPCCLARGLKILEMSRTDCRKSEIEVPLSQFHFSKQQMLARRMSPSPFPLFRRRGRMNPEGQKSTNQEGERLGNKISCQSSKPALQARSTRTARTEVTTPLSKNTLSCDRHALSLLVHLRQMQRILMHASYH